MAEALAVMKEIPCLLFILITATDTRIAPDKIHLAVSQTVDFWALCSKYRGPCK